MSNDQFEALRDRFGESNTPGIQTAVEEAALRDYNMQILKEKENLMLLGLGSDSAERQTYQALSGNPEAAAQFLEWFSIVAPRAFDAAFEGTNRYVPPQPKVALELFGTAQQYGEWETTSTLDHYARRLGEMLLQLASPPDVITLEDPKDYPSKYLYLPMHREEEGKSEQHVYDYGQVVRVRGVADLHFSSQDMPEVKIEVFKRSLAVVKLRDVQDNEHEVLQLIGPDSTPEQRAAANETAGFIFERAIQAHEGVTTDIIPISARYVMMVRRPSAA